MRSENMLIWGAVVIGVILSFGLSIINPTGAFTYAPSTLPADIVKSEGYYGTTSVILEHGENDIFDVPWNEKAIGAAASYAAKKVPNSKVISPEARNKLASALKELVLKDKPSALQNLDRMRAYDGKIYIVAAWKFDISTKKDSETGIESKEVIVYNDWYFKNQKSSLKNNRGTLRGETENPAWVRYDRFAFKFVYDPATGSVL